MVDVLILVGFFSMLGAGFLGLRAAAGRSIDKYVAENTPPVDTRYEKRKRRAEELKDWNYQFAYLQSAHNLRKKTQ